MTDVLSLAWERYAPALGHCSETSFDFDTQGLDYDWTPQSSTSAVLSGLSNITAQRMMSNAPLHWRRAFAMAAFGYFITAPATHYWHKLLEKLFPSRSKDGKTDDLSPLKKVLLDVFTFGPILNGIALAYISIVVDGRSIDFTKQKLKNDYPGVVFNAWKVWPVIHFVNYKYVRPQLRVPFVSAAAFFWSVFLILRAKGTLSVK